MTELKENQYNPDYCSYPGQTLQETLEHANMSAEDLALKIGIPLETIDGFLRGVTPLTLVLAERLSDTFNIPESFWLRAEVAYRSHPEKPTVVKAFVIHFQIKWRSVGISWMPMPAGHADVVIAYRHHSNAESAFTDISNIPHTYVNPIEECEVTLGPVCTREYDGVKQQVQFCDAQSVGFCQGCVRWAFLNYMFNECDDCMTRTYHIDDVAKGRRNA